MIETDPLSLTFAACFAIGLLYLLITALSGTGHGQHQVAHHHVHVTSHPSGVQGAHHTTTQTHMNNGFSLLAYLNPNTFVFFLLGFGFFGYLLHNTTDFVLPLIILLAAVGGVVISALLLAFIARIFGNSEAATIQDVSDRTGLIGKVSVTIQPDSLGEILYVSPGGMRKSIPAKSTGGRRLERDQEVVVVNYHRGIAEVDTWEHFVNQEEIEPSATMSSDTDELATLRALLGETNMTDSDSVTKNDSHKE
ncbi:MAG TPA: hypothetical protein VL461_02370 [Dictyobacter sp.]|jgi:hypothetical protein|nr:hypothetical protein [Dictyobacter sp.]